MLPIELFDDEAELHLHSGESCVINPLLVTLVNTACNRTGKRYAPKLTKILGHIKLCTVKPA
jgi:hypothetical protein